MEELFRSLCGGGVELSDGTSGAVSRLEAVLRCKIHELTGATKAP